LDVQPNPPSELPFLPAVDVPAAFSEIPFRAEDVYTAARQAHGDTSEVDASSVSWPVAEF
jgi:hypothetical protein